MKSQDIWMKKNCLVLIAIFLAFSQIVFCQGTPKSATSAKSSTHLTHNAPAIKPSPNHDLVGPWVPLNRSEDIGLSINLIDYPEHPCEMWPPHQDEPELCSIERRGRAIVFNGSGRQYRNLDAPNHLLLTVVDGDIMRGVIYPSNIKFVLHRQNGYRDTVIYPEAGDALSGDVWSDTSTGLMWTRRDSGSRAINWNEAVSHCNNLRLGGYDSWRLPDLNELESLSNRSNPTIVYGREASPNTLKINSAIRLSANVLAMTKNDGTSYGYRIWSNTQGNTSSNHIAIDFIEDLPIDKANFAWPNNLKAAAALCVRRLGD